MSVPSPAQNRAARTPAAAGADDDGDGDDPAG